MTSICRPHLVRTLPILPDGSALLTTDQAGASVQRHRRVPLATGLGIALAVVALGVVQEARSQPDQALAAPAANSAAASTTPKVCGPNSLYMLLKLAGIAVQHHEIDHYRTDHPQGMSMLELKRACADFGLNTAVVQCSTADLRRIDYPAIARVQRDFQGEFEHFIVLTHRINHDLIEILDGTTGLRREYAIDKMDNVWDGHLLIIAAEPRGETLHYVLAAMTTVLCGATVYLVGRRRQLPPAPAVV